MNFPIVVTQKAGKSVNQRKSDALIAVAGFDGIPPKWGLPIIAGITNKTLLQWEKEDPQFKEDLTKIIMEKKLKVVELAYKGLGMSLMRGDPALVKAALVIQDPENWSDEETDKPVEREYLVGLYGEPRKVVDIKAKEIPTENDIRKQAKP